MLVVRVRGWLAKRHSLPVELSLVVGLYLVYEGARGLVAQNAARSVRHAHLLVSLEQSVHVFFEGGVQHAASAVPGLTGLLGIAYLGMHLSVTAALLLWVHQRRAAAFAFVRTTLLVASGLALVGFLVFPTAPPRLAGIGIADTVSAHEVTLNGGLVNLLYNPYAAVPSMHIGYALVVGATLIKLARHRALRVAGALYPLLMLLVVTATGNHFFFDAFAGALVAALASVAALRIARSVADTGVVQAIDAVRPPPPECDELAA